MWRIRFCFLFMAGRGSDSFPWERDFRGLGKRRLRWCSGTSAGRGIDDRELQRRTMNVAQMEQDALDVANYGSGFIATRFSWWGIRRAALGARAGARASRGGVRVCGEPLAPYPGPSMNMQKVGTVHGWASRLLGP